MKKLLILDSKNYTDDMRAFEKYAVRTIIVKNGRIATQHGAAGDYKIVGGGIENGETYIDTIMREVREEAGLLVKQDSIVELGEIEEIRKDLYHEDEKFICHSYFYYCEVEDETVDTNMTMSEIKKGYHLCWATPKEIIDANSYFHYLPWIYRDTRFVEMLQNHQFDNVVSLKTENESRILVK
ncbi:NUDIX hydrolase [Lachnobacterium bovis]|uniref:NUDIX domain-containing protein n=1 Tax=Lachnobacterium bovis DSM 14045 TaxID=1122142 RepID=A0A1H3KBC9_9FIRM|nr:NUDIX domain-containing protein [Lachnobacterium bovis]MBQ1801971.1 NUDIX domain-containing protein [Lachnobacterium sp.]SDY49527.1 NUDIX domain-containing protein [Lachnobacterium bovis DSM 14045]